MIRHTLFLILLNQSLQGQVVVTLRDKITNHTISYANMWKDKSLYKTSDSTGVFIVDNKDVDNYFKITCIGYTDTIVKMSQEIFVNQNAIALDEVKIVKCKKQTTFKLGKAKRGNTVYGVQFDAKMPQTAKYFSNSKRGTSYVNKVKFCAEATAKNRIVSVLFYTVNDKGEPHELINTENVLYTFKKGRHITEIDVNKLNIEFPKEGIFVVIQHLLLEQNKNYSGDPNPAAFVYEPLISVDYTNGYEDSWYFNEGDWHKNEKYSVNMEIVLTN